MKIKGIIFSILKGHNESLPPLFFKPHYKIAASRSTKEDYPEPIRPDRKPAHSLIAFGSRYRAALWVHSRYDRSA